MTYGDGAGSPLPYSVPQDCRWQGTKPPTRVAIFACPPSGLGLIVSASAPRSLGELAR